MYVYVRASGGRSLALVPIGMGTYLHTGTYLLLGYQYAEDVVLTTQTVLPPLRTLPCKPAHRRLAFTVHCLPCDERRGVKRASRTLFF